MGVDVWIEMWAEVWGREEDVRVARL